MPRFLVLATLVLLVCSPALARQAPCSGKTVSAKLPAQAGLPAPVAAMRNAIAQAAARCDFDKLGKLALAGDLPFIFTFGSAEEGPAAFWRAREAEGEPVLATMVKLLRLPYVKEVDASAGTIFTWPSAAGDRPSDKDWRALRPLFPSEKAWKQQVESYRRDIGAYIGDRVGITETGDWIYFVAGD